MENTPNELPKEDLISDYVNEMREMDLEHNQRTIKRARNALYIVAVFVFIGEMVAMFMSDEGFDYLTLIIAIFEAGIFAALAIWTKRKPYTAIITGIIAYVALLILSVAYSGYVNGGEAAIRTIVSGIIIKVAILVTLFKALNDAKTVQNYKKI
jgi:tryptophan-rich sensory protein